LVVGDIKVIIALRSIIHMNYSVSSYFTKFDLGFKGFYIISLSHRLRSGCIFIRFGLLYNLSKSRGFYFGKGLFLTDLILGFLMFFRFWVNLNRPFSLGFFGEIFIFLGVFCYFNYLTYLVLIIFVSILYNAYIGRYFLCLFRYNYKSIKLNLSRIYLICI
jgi:NADH:ubiquinone oxidoreductase subunit 4 (subunit M)